MAGVGTSDVGLLVTRATTGGLLAGHGSQKLFGWFGGYGLQGTGGWLESLGMRPGHVWARAAVLGEVGGGLLTALGLFHPIGPILMLGPMGVAIEKVHWGKPIWVAEGGAELPATNVAVALGVALSGPGRYSLDRMLGIKVPGWLTALVAAGTLAGILMAHNAQPAPAPQSAPTDQSGSELQTGQGGAHSEAV